MPSTNQGGTQRQRRHFDDEHADAAARWLDWDLLSHPQRRQTVRSIIKGIDRIERVRAWEAAERRLAKLDDREPRAKILQWLDQREEWLQLHGERPHRNEERPGDRNLAPVECSYPDRDDIDKAADRATFSAERAFGPLQERYPHLFEDDDSAADNAETDAVAADGGDAE